MLGITAKVTTTSVKERPFNLKFPFSIVILLRLLYNNILTCKYQNLSMFWVILISEHIISIISIL